MFGGVFWFLGFSFVFIFANPICAIVLGNNYYDAEIKNAYVTGAVTGNDRVGGLVGENLAAKIENTYALGKVTGTTAVGGLLGKNVQGVVTNSYWVFTKA